MCVVLRQRQSCASASPTPATTSPTATAPTSSASTRWPPLLMVYMARRQRKPGMAAFYNATAENASPLAVAGCLGMSGVV